MCIRDRVFTEINKPLLDSHPDIKGNDNNYSLIMVEDKGNKNYYLANKKADFVAVFQLAAKHLALNGSDGANKLMNLFISNVWFENYFEYHVESISEELRWTLKKTYKVLKELVEGNYILKTKSATDKRLNLYFLNPYYAYRGSTKQHKTSKTLVPANQTEFVSTFYPTEMKNISEEMPRTPNKKQSA